MGFVVLLIVGLVLYGSYRLYVSPLIEENINPSRMRSTPARRQMDGVRFFPARASVLTGFQLRSISLDVIIAPVIAVQFGWLPAILWLIVGAVFFGWVNDYMSAIISVRSSGKTFAQLFDLFFNSKSRILIYWFLLIFLLIIISQFSLLLTSLLSRTDLPFGTITFVMVGLLAGTLIFRTQTNLIIITLLSLALTLAGFWISTSSPIEGIFNHVNQLISNLDNWGSIDTTFGSISVQSFVYLFLVYTVCYLSSVLPTWRLAVPFNFLSNLLVVAAFVMALVGLFLGTLRSSTYTNFELPALTTVYQPNLGPIWPILFVTLSSGAISGWHALVSSFTTSRQVEKEPVLKPVTTVAMYAETMIVAIIIIFAAIFGLASGIFNPDQNFTLASGPAAVFATGLVNTWQYLGISPQISASISAILLTLMGISILQLAVRYARGIQSELLGNRIPLLKNHHSSTIIILMVVLVLLLFGLRDQLWMLFFGANQIIAGSVLMFATIWLAGQCKNIWWTFLPSIFIYLTGMAAIIYTGIYIPLLNNSIANPENSPFLTIEIIPSLVLSIFFTLSAGYIYSVGIGKLRIVWLKIT
jgi:carbon starvation protein